MKSQKFSLLRGLCNQGQKPQKLIRLDYKETKQYNYNCKVHKITSIQRLDYALEVAPSRTNLQRNFTRQSLKSLFRNSLFTALLALFALGFSACATKPIVKIQTKEVFIPIQCNLTLPPKPKENGSFESHKALAKYYKEVEQIAKDCTKDSNAVLK